MSPSGGRLMPVTGVTSANSRRLFVCLQNNSKGYEQIIKNVLENVDHGPMSRLLHYDDVPDSGGTLCGRNETLPY